MPVAANDQIHTELFRYPELFGYVHFLQKVGFLPPNPRILSFGCSTGEELLSLRHYFPTAHLFGCDVVEDALAQAQALTAADPLLTVFRSTLGNIRSHGPYDLVMCNSVLCINSPDPHMVKRELPFSRFEDLLCGVVQYLSPEGVMCVFNPSYLPDESPDFLRVAKPVRSHFSPMGYVPKFSSAGTALLRRIVADGKGYYEVADGADPALLRLTPNTFYTRNEALRSFRIDYSGLPHCRTLDRFQPPNRKLVIEAATSHMTPAFYRDIGWGWPRHDNLDQVAVGFMPEMMVRIPGATDGFVSLS